MKFALIASNETTTYVSGWDEEYNPPKAIRTILGWRIAEVEDTELFPVEMPLFWVECNDDVNSTDYYYDEINKEIKPIPPSPPIPNNDESTNT